MLVVGENGGWTRTTPGLRVTAIYGQEKPGSETGRGGLAINTEVRPPCMATTGQEGGRASATVARKKDLKERPHHPERAIHPGA